MRHFHHRDVLLEQHALRRMHAICKTALEVISIAEAGLPNRYKYHAAYIFDSAAAFFGRDNVGLPGVAHFFKVNLSR